jgi:pimeloyl-ACP methyl ester carboxylesterase
MVLADTSPAFGMDGTRRDEWIASRLAPLESGSVLADVAETVVDTITAVPLRGEIRAETVGAFSHITADGFRAAVECLPDNDVRAELHRIEHPTLVVVGELDRETPVSYSEVLADGLAHAELRVIAGAGHLTPAEAPDQFNRLVAAFLTADGTNQRGRHDDEHRSQSAAHA